MVLIPTDIAQVLLLDRVYDAEGEIYNREVAASQAFKNCGNTVFSLLFEVEGAFDEAYLLRSGRR